MSATTAAGAVNPQAVMFEELAQWQATAPVTRSLDLNDVLAAARPLLNGRFAWSVSTMIGNPLSQYVSLLHCSGGELGTMAPDGIGPALANLLGLMVGNADAAASAKLDELIEQADAAAKPAKAKAKPAAKPAAITEPECASEPDGADDDPIDAADDLEAELSAADHQTCLAMLKALAPDARKQFAVAFRSHFEIGDDVKAVGGCIKQVKHQLFVRDFVDEIELLGVS